MIGSILFNGNVVREEDFIDQFKDRILQSDHIDPAVRKSKKVLLITGAWRDNEFNESHVKEALKDIGIPSRYRNGYDENIQNLSVYHEWMQFHEQHPAIKEIYFRSLEKLYRIKRFYRERNATLVNLLQHHSRALKKDIPGISLSEVLSYPSADEDWRVTQMTDGEVLQHYSCQEIQKTLAYLIGGDALQGKISREIQDCAKIRSGVLGNPDYQKRRKELIDRILSANSIFIFGGEVASLYYSLKFWDLDQALSEALMRGTNFYTVSAGTIIFGEKIIVYGETTEESGARNRYFEFFDNGFGLVTKIRLFPHCRDRIQTDDPDNLSFLAYRFQGRICVGLNEDSFLLLDTHQGPDGRLYPRFTSMGQKDGVYAFESSGRKVRYDFGEQLLVPGTLIWEQEQAESHWAKRKTLSSPGQTLWDQ